MVKIKQGLDSNYKNKYSAEKQHNLSNKKNTNWIKWIHVPDVSMHTVHMKLELPVTSSPRVILLIALSNKVIHWGLGKEEKKIKIRDL